VLGPGEPYRAAQANLSDGARLKDVAAFLAERWGRSKRDVYQELLALSRGA